MNETWFVDRREPDWRRLSQLCDRAEGSPSALNPNDFHDFIKLYRKASSDLALARTQSANAQLIDFLNDLVSRAYGILYRTPRNSLIQGVAVSIAIAAATMRRCRWFLLASLLVFLGGGFLSFFAADYFPDTRDVLVPPQTRELFKQWEEGAMEERSASQSTVMTSMYATHNPTVAIVSASAAAATFGVGTFMLVGQNGMILGSLAHEVRPYGRLGYLFGHILPHGVPEISGLLIAGAAGFVMGWALINPGRRRRGEALKVAGKDAIVLLATGIMLTFFAAPIEGFFSFNPRVPMALKVAVGAVEIVAWAAFWVFYGRSEATESTS